MHRVRTSICAFTLKPCSDIGWSGFVLNDPATCLDALKYLITIKHVKLSPEDRLGGRGAHSSTFWLNLSAFCVLGRACNGCLWGVKGLFRGCLGLYWVLRGCWGVLRGLSGLHCVRNG
jgi:hypothetical protein